MIFLAITKKEAELLFLVIAEKIIGLGLQNPNLPCTVIPNNYYP